MAKDNIYDLILAELILKAAAAASVTSAPNILLSHTLSGNTVAENFNGNTVYTSNVVNIPSGYTIQANSHTITYPIAVPPTTVSSAVSVTGPTVNVILGAAGTTFTVNATVTLTHATLPNIVLNATSVITAVAPIYYGVKAYAVTPNVVGLATIASNATTFQMTTSILGRIYVVTPVTANSITAIVDQNGMVYTIVGDFTVSVVGAQRFYILNYDTQLTGTNIKTFTLIY